MKFYNYFLILGCKNSVGQTMEHGQKWIHPTDLCQVCSCEDGISKCERVECDVPCTHPVVQANRCCPECNGKLFISKRVSNYYTIIKLKKLI